MKTDNILIRPSKLKGEIDAISSKSFAHRALILAGLCENPTNIYINEFSKDINVTIEALKNLGVKIEKNENSVKIIPPKEKKEQAKIDMYESGSSLRFFTGVCSHFSKNTEIIGEKRLGERPNLELIKNLREHGLKISSEKIPYMISGEIKSGEFEFLENKSSQYISAIMLSASKISGKTTIKLKEIPESLGYIDITRKVLKDFNVSVEKEDHSYFIENPQIKSPKNYYVEGDWSNSAFFYGANLINSQIKINNLNKNSLQKDREIVEIIEKIKICKKENKGLEIDISQIPDLCPILAVLLTILDKDSYIINGKRLRLKESDRLESTSKMLNDLGAKCEIIGDSLKISGKIKMGEVDSFNDHRIVMASAIASLLSSGDIIIKNYKAVNKSYPSFFETFKKLGGRFEYLGDWMEDLKEIRENINEIDEKIIGLLEKRFDLSKKVRAYKISHNKKVYDPKREKEILKKIEEKSPEYGKYFVPIYKEIMAQSKNLQNKKENYGLLGKTLGHSYSKIIHEKIGYYSYQYFEKNEEELDDFFEKKDFKGINVTIPYKNTVIKYLDFISKKAEKIGAVNTIVNKEGKLYGYNTDYYGFSYDLKKNNIEIKDKKCLILGKGASSKTVNEFLKDLGAKEIVFLSRKFKPYFKDVKDYFDFEVIINTTPVGMYPNNDEYIEEINLEKFEKLEAVVDLIYNPYMTKILSHAKEKNIKYASGFEMLIAQAVKASELFLDKKFDENLIFKIKKSIYREKMNISLIGMAGSGKTSLGKILAKNMNRDFVDLDEEFEKKYGSIEEFFENYGEDEFRKKESQILKEFSKKTGLIISCGGGIVEKSENYYRLKENSIVVNIKRDLEKLEIYKRPLSKKYGIENLYKKRKELYEKFKDFEVENENLDFCAKKIEEKFYENISN